MDARTLKLSRVAPVANMLRRQINDFVQLSENSDLPTELKDELFQKAHSLEASLFRAERDAETLMFGIELK